MLEWISTIHFPNEFGKGETLLLCSKFMDQQTTHYIDDDYPYKMPISEHFFNTGKNWLRALSKRSQIYHLMLSFVKINDLAVIQMILRRFVVNPTLLVSTWESGITASFFWESNFDTTSFLFEKKTKKNPHKMHFKFYKVHSTPLPSTMNWYETHVQFRYLPFRNFGLSDID